MRNYDNTIKFPDRINNLIAIYTGYRLEGTCQLHMNNIERVDRYYAFDINLRMGRS